MEVPPFTRKAKFEAYGEEMIDKEVKQSAIPWTRPSRRYAVKKGLREEFMTSEDVTLLHLLYKIKTDRMCRFRNLEGKLRRKKQDVSTLVTEFTPSVSRSSPRGDISR